MYGDMGATTDQFRNVAPSIPVLVKDQEDDMFDGVIHAGDYAYVAPRRPRSTSDPNRHGRAIDLSRVLARRFPFGGGGVRPGGGVANASVGPAVVSGEA